MHKKTIVAVLIVASALLLSSVPMFAQAAQSAPGAGALGFMIYVMAAGLVLVLSLATGSR